MAKIKDGVLRIYNSSKQMIPIQVKPPGGDFYTSEQQIRLAPGKDVVLPKSHLRMAQIDNLKRRRMLKVVYDSDTADEVINNTKLEDVEVKDEE